LREQLGSISCTLKFAPAFERIFGEPSKFYHGLSFSFFRLLLSFSFSKEKERNGHLLNKK